MNTDAVSSTIDGAASGLAISSTDTEDRELDGQPRGLNVGGVGLDFPVLFCMVVGAIWIISFCGVPASIAPPPSLTGSVVTTLKSMILRPAAASFASLSMYR